MTIAIFPEAPARLLDLIFQRGEFTRQTASPDVGHAAGAATRSRSPTPVSRNPGNLADRRKQAMALKAFNDEVAALEAMCGVHDPQNDQLNIAAMKLGQFIAAGLLSRTVVEAALEAACIGNTLVAQTSLRAVQATIKSGLEFGLSQPRDFSHIDEEAANQARRTSSPRTPEPLDPHHSPSLGEETPKHSEEPETAAPVDDCHAGPVRPLGHHGGTYFYLSKAGEIRRLQDKDHKRLQILSLFDGDDDWLIEHCPAYDKSGEVRAGAWNQESAAKRLIRLAARQGLFDPNTPVRGPGVWRTAQDQLVVHVGDAIATLSRDACVALERGSGNLRWEHAGQVIDGGLYAATARCQRPAKAPAKRSAGQTLLEGLRLWHYDTPLSADIILGFLGSALLGGAPSWRVHLLLSAQGGSGKTSLMNFLDAALGGMGAYANDSTEAGLRQALTGETRVLLIDEAEGNEGSQGKVEGVIRLLRLMSSGAGANVMRGSAGGRAQSFQVTGCAAMAAILPPPLKPQDRSRICVVNVLRPPSGKTTARAAEQAEAAIKHARQLAPGLRTRAIAGWPRFLDTFSLYRSGLVARGLSGRNADTLATILTGRDLLLQDMVPDADSIDADLERFAPFMASADEAEDEGEGQQCLTHLYTSPFDRWHQGERSTVGELIMEKRNDLLARVGLKLLPVDEGGGLLIANQHVGLSRIFEGSKWSDGRWVTALRYLEGAKPFSKAVRMAGALTRATLLPLELLPRSDER